MKRPALRPRKDPGGSGKERPSLDVQIYRSEAGYTAVVQTGEKTRQISDKGATCRGLADAMAITLAILLDTEVPPPEPEPPPPAATTPEPKPTEAKPASDEKPKPAPAPAPTALTPPFTAPPRAFRVVAGAGATVATGLLTQPRSAPPATSGSASGASSRSKRGSSSSRRRPSPTPAS